MKTDSLSTARLLGLALVLFLVFLYLHSDEKKLTPKLEVDRAQARQIAQRFLSEQGFEVADYRHSSVFEYSNRTKTFLERELGPEGMESYLEGPLRIWWWQNRWCKELEYEEFWVDVGLDGRVTYFYHKLSRDAEGASLALEEARELAKRVLENREIAWDSLELASEESVEQSNRTDHSFAWLLKGSEKKGARIRYEINIYGDQLGYYREYLERPQQWERDYKELRSRNEAANTVAGTFGNFLECLILVALLGHLIRRETSIRELNLEPLFRPKFRFWTLDFWFPLEAIRKSYAFRCFFVTTVVVLLGQINRLPQSLHRYDTTESLKVSYGGTAFQVVGVCGSYAIYFVLLCWCCSLICRSVYPQRLSISWLLSWSALRARGFVELVALGLALFGAHAVFVELFYGVAESMGAWSPLPIEYGALLTGVLPWASALNTGFLAAVAEELVYRVFAITWLKRLGAPTWLAVGGPALLWGFQHCLYPQQPFFIRGLELTLIGIVYGLVYLRWGMIPCLVGHYTWNAFVSSEVLIYSQSSYLILSGVMCSGVALFLIVLGSALRRRFGLLEYAPEEAAEPPPDPPLSALERPSPKPSRMVATILGVLMLISLVVHFGSEGSEPLGTISVTRSQALEAARTEMRERGLAVEKYRETVSFKNYSDEAEQYFWERGGKPYLRLIYPEILRVGTWKVRYFQPQQLEEFRVEVDGITGKPVFFIQVMSEDAAGSELEPAAAEELARQLILKRTGRKAGETLLSSQEKRKARVDHSFAFLITPPEGVDLGEARFFDSVQVLGDQAQQHRCQVEIPQTWYRQRALEPWWMDAGGLALLFVLGLLALVGFWAGAKRIRGAAIDYRQLLRYLSPIGLGMVLIALLDLPEHWGGYSTSEHPWSFWATKISGDLELVAMAMLFFAFFWLLVVALNPAWFRVTPQELRWGPVMALVAICLGLGVGAVDHWFAVRNPAVFDSPSLALLGFAKYRVLRTLVWALLSGLLCYLLGGMLRGGLRLLGPRRTALVVVLCVALTLVSQSKNSTELRLLALAYFPSLLFVVLLWRVILVRNPVAWYHLGFLSSLLDDASKGIVHPLTHSSAVILYGIAVVWTGAWLWWARKELSLEDKVEPTLFESQGDTDEQSEEPDSTGDGAGGSVP